MHSLLNKYLAFMLPSIKPVDNASHVQNYPGFNCSASKNMPKPLVKTTAAPLNQTSAASSLSVCVDALNMNIH